MYHFNGTELRCQSSCLPVAGLKLKVYKYLLSMTGILSRDTSTKAPVFGGMRTCGGLK